MSKFVIQELNLWFMDHGDFKINYFINENPLLRISKEFLPSYPS